MTIFSRQKVRNMCSPQPVFSFLAMSAYLKFGRYTIEDMDTYSPRVPQLCTQLQVTKNKFYYYTSSKISMTYKSIN